MCVELYFSQQHHANVRAVLLAWYSQAGAYPVGGVRALS